jgi:hypothetical protein
MSSPSRPPDPSENASDAHLFLGALPSVATTVREMPGAAADAALARSALRASLVELARTGQRVAHDPQEVDRWENEGGPPAGPADREPDEQVAQGRERRALAAHAVSHDDVVGAVRTYTQILRRGGVPLAAAVRGHAATHPSGDAGDGVERDAARSCLEAYHGR